MPKKIAALDKFMANIDMTVGPDACWLWKSATISSGYGNMLITVAFKRRVNLKAHRFSWMHWVGPIPVGLCVLHSCDARYPVGDITYRRCVNPAHLWLGTNSENMADMAMKGRAVGSSGDANGTHTRPDRVARGDRHGSRTKPERVPRGDRNGSRTHPLNVPRGESHGESKLTNENVLYIRKRISEGEIQRVLAAELGVCRELIGHVARRVIWKHI